MKDAKVFGLKFGALLAGLSLVCGILLYTAPDLTMQVAGYLTHSSIQFAAKPFDLWAFVLGLLLWGIIGTAIGYIIAKMC